MNTRHRPPQRGFTLLEALIALLVMAFGMLALSGMQLSLSRSADIAKQRTEAMRLAQRKVDELRSFTTIAPAAGHLIVWDNFAATSETVSTNALYKLTTAFGGATADAMRGVTVTVRWLDRAGQGAVDDGSGFFYNQQVVLASVIAKTDPIEIGFVGNPLPLNQPLKRPKNRNINIPIPAVDLGGGQSATQFDANYVIIYSDVDAGVVKICDPNQANATAAQINAAIANGNCTDVAGYIVAGYIGRFPENSTVQWPTGINHSGISRNNALSGQSIRCMYSDARNISTGALITANNGFKYYLCMIPLSAPHLWSGTIRLGGVPTTGNYLVCRYQYTQTDITANERNVQPYADVNLSIDEQNYLITTNSTCPSSMTQTGHSTGVLHQDCRTSNSANHATACPASS